LRAGFIERKESFVMVHILLAYGLLNFWQELKSII